MMLEKLLANSDLYSDREKILYSKFKDKILIRSQTLYVPKVICEQFIKETQKYELAISGIDVFIITDKGVKPIDIADYSNASDDTWEEYKNSCFKSSLEFLKLNPSNPDVYYEFILLGQSEWEDSSKR